MQHSDNQPLSRTERLDRRINFFRMSGAKLRKLMLLQAVLFALLLATSATFVLLAYVFYDYPGVWEDLILVIVMRLAILDHYLLMGSGALCTLSYILQWWTEAQKEATDES